MKVVIALLVIGGLALVSYKVIKREEPQPSMVAAIPVPTSPDWANLAKKGVITPAQANNGANTTTGAAIVKGGLKGSTLLTIKNLVNTPSIKSWF